MEQSETSLQNDTHSAGKWHVDSEVRMGSGPIAFSVLLWDISHLPVSVLALDALSAYLKSYNEIRAPLSWPHVKAAMQFSLT